MGSHHSRSHRVQRHRHGARLDGVSLSRDASFRLGRHLQHSNRSWQSENIRGISRHSVIHVCDVGCTCSTTVAACIMYDRSTTSHIPTVQFRLAYYIVAECLGADEHYEWRILSGWRHLFAYIGALGIVSIVELNAFYLKSTLWIPVAFSFSFVWFIFPLWIERECL